VVGRSLESILAVTAGLDEIIQTFDELLSVHSHGYPSTKNFAIAMPVVAMLRCLLIAQN
jgi:hypothetical protein